ncbi:MAG TPA: HTH domain-containing protein [Candidatus Lokiarchaeia archaeon]|nr:HTH domain-containing protein [Candidatus Lokiarchaeia archaeon]
MRGEGAKNPRKLPEKRNQAFVITFISRIKMRRLHIARAYLYKDLYYNCSYYARAYLYRSLYNNCSYCARARSFSDGEQFTDKQQALALQPKSNIDGSTNLLAGQILTFLKGSEFGRNMSQIAEELHLSRNTVAKHLERLERSGAALYQQVGPAKIWFAKKNTPLSQTGELNSFFQTIIRQFFQAFMRCNSEPIQNQQDLMKRIGREMASHINWPSGKIIGELEIPSEIHPTLDRVVNFTRQCLELMNAAGFPLHAEIVPILAPDPSSAILLRVTDSEMLPDQGDLFHQLLAGYSEAKLQEVFGNTLYLRVREVQTENSCFYLELGIREPAP